MQAITSHGTIFKTINAEMNAAGLLKDYFNLFFSYENVFLATNYSPSWLWILNMWVISKPHCSQYIKAWHFLQIKKSTPGQNAPPQHIIYQHFTHQAMREEYIDNSVKCTIDIFLSINAWFYIWNKSNTNQPLCLYLF